MKKISKLGPSPDELNQTYHLLLHSPKELDAKAWVLYSRYARFDARLAEIWIKALSQVWQLLSPLALNNENRLYETPASLGLLLEQVYSYLIPLPDHALFQKWKDLVLCNTEIAHFENFLIGGDFFATEKVRNEAFASSKLYLKWGFVGREPFVNKWREKQKNLQVTEIDPERRKIVLNGLIQNAERINVADYLEATGHTISIRIAQLDLSKHPELTAKGNSRAKFYVKRLTARNK